MNDKVEKKLAWGFLLHCQSKHGKALKLFWVHWPSLLGQRADTVAPRAY